MNAPVESTPVDRLYQESVAILDVLRQREEEVSLQLAAADNFRKGLLLGAASYFESRVCRTVLDFVSQTANRSILVEQLVRNKAIARQYHTWFQWERRNANQFFALFGEQFKTTMSDRVKNSDELQNSVEAFLEIGNQRNCLIHQDYATFPLDKTLDEIYALYKSALLFVQTLPGALRESDRTLRPPISFDDIQTRAYFISEARCRAGAVPDPVADWHQAERELNC